MKLSKELKEKIDNYFDKISAEELFGLAKKKYGFTECNVEVENQGFSTMKKSYYSALNPSLIIIEEKNQNAFASAA